MTKIDIAVAFLYFAYLFIPGYICWYLLKLKRYKFLYSYTISFALLILTQLPYRFLGESVTHWLWTLHILIVVLVFIAILRFYLDSDKRSSAYLELSTEGQVVHNRNYASFVFIVIVLIVSTYHGLVGPYTEIPSDYWEHLARTTAAKIQLADNQFDTTATFKSTVLLKTDVLYFLHALVAQVFGASTIVTTTGATLVGSVVFLGSTYWFGLRLTKRIFVDHRLKILTAALAVLITILSLGTSTFSYVRYYSYFPTVFCFPLVFLGVAVVIDYLEDQGSSIISLGIIPIILIVLNIVHQQEALFLVVLLFGMVFWRTLRTFLPNNNIPVPLYFRHRVFSICALCGLVAVSITVITLKHESNWLGNPHIATLPNYLPIVGGLPIADPSFRFWDTLGFYGILVYLLYLFNLNKFRGLDYINFGMFSPVLTHFNPAYVFLFLHVDSASVLWRTSYLVPLAFTTAIGLTIFVRQFFVAARPTYRLLVILSLAVGVITLSPITYDSRFNRLSRIPSLQEVHSSSGAQLWEDLIMHVGNLHKDNKASGILTDNVTKFVLDSAVFGKIPERGNLNYFPANNLSYKTDIENSDFTDYLLIINKRNGLITSSALYSGHWPSNTLAVASRYPTDILDFIRKNPAHFSLTWQHNDISIYKITSFHNTRINL